MHKAADLSHEGSIQNALIYERHMWQETVIDALSRDFPKTTRHKRNRVRAESRPHVTSRYIFWHGFFTLWIAPNERETAANWNLIHFLARSLCSIFYVIYCPGDFHQCCGEAWCFSLLRGCIAPWRTETSNIRRLTRFRMLGRRRCRAGWEKWCQKSRQRISDRFA